MKRVPHPSGVDIIFDTKWHQYKIGQTSLRSVSKLLDKHFPFDEKRMLAAVSRKTGQSVAEVKASWSRQALLGKNIHEYIEAKLAGLPLPTWTFLLPGAVKSPATRRNGGKKAAKEKSGEVESLRQSAVDVMLHGEEEAYIKAADHVVDKILGNYDIIAVEQIIASPSWGIGGTVDFIARNKRTKKLFIGDWKTSGSVASAFRFGSFETPCSGCLLHLPNSKFYRYAMQVIVYGEILKHEGYLYDGFFGKIVKPISKSVENISLNKCEVNGALEYGIVQMLKSEEGGVCVEFQNVTESTVLPVDANEVTFIELLKNVMRG